jgi:hypothetical protein
MVCYISCELYVRALLYLEIRVSWPSQSPDLKISVSVFRVTRGIRVFHIVANITEGLLNIVLNVENNVTYSPGACLRVIKTYLVNSDLLE